MKKDDEEKLNKKMKSSKWK